MTDAQKLADLLDPPFAQPSRDIGLPRPIHCGTRTMDDLQIEWLMTLIRGALFIDAQKLAECDEHTYRREWTLPLNANPKLDSGLPFL